MDTYLEHHGIIGMKWGVRRYQNYDGSYTQAGMKRYNRSMENYEKANERVKSLKKNGGSKADITNAKVARKSAKRKLEKDYRHLKQDKLGDQGKELYGKGKTITGNENFTRIMETIGSLSWSAAAYNYKEGTFGNQKVTNWLAGIGAAAITVGEAKRIVDNYEAKRLRAYYGHTSNY